jgi:hypothetical protein
MVRTAAGFHTYHGMQRNGSLQDIQPFRTGKLAAPHCLLASIDTVHLENVFCEINPNANNVHLGFLLVDRSSTPLIMRRVPVG